MSTLWPITFKGSRMAESLHVRYSILSQIVVFDIMWQYSDYRGLKKHISAIRRWQEGLQPLPPSTLDAKDSRSEVRHKSRVSWSASEHGDKIPNRRRLSMPTFTRSRPNSQSQAIPLYAILLTLPPIHIAFFTLLDNELAKIDGFYLEREKEAQARSRALQNQLRELKDHRKVFYVSWLIFLLRVRVRSDTTLSKRKHIRTLAPLGRQLWGPTSNSCLDHWWIAQIQYRRRCRRWDSASYYQR